MAWVVVPGSGGVWEYDNAATAADTYADANGTTVAGVRTFIPSNGGPSQLIYIKTRKAGETAERGELSKTFYDAISGEIPFIPAQQLQTLFGNNSGILVIPERQYLFTDSLGTVPVENPGDPVLSVREQGPQNLLLSVVGGTYGVDEDREFILLDGTGFIGAPPVLSNTNEIFFASAMRKTATVASHSTRFTRFTRWVESDSQGLYYDRNNLRLYLKAVRTGGTDVRPEVQSMDTLIPVGTDWIVSSEASTEFSAIRINEILSDATVNSGTALANQTTDNIQLFQQIPGRVYGAILVDRNLNYADREILYISLNAFMSTTRRFWSTTVAHRGFADCITENTMDAFNTAIEGGVEWLECDVQASANGSAYMFHDATIDSRTTGTGNFSDLADTYINVQMYDSDGSFRAIARFQDLLDLMVENTSVQLMAEIKDKGNIGDTFIDTFMNLIISRGLQSRVVVCSFFLTDLEYIRANYSPTIRLGYVVDVADTTSVDTCRALGNTILLAPRATVSGTNNALVNYAHDTAGSLEYVPIAGYTIDTSGQLVSLSDSNSDYAICDSALREGTGSICLPLSRWMPDYSNPVLTIGPAVTTQSVSPFVGGGNSYRFLSSTDSYISTPASNDWVVGTDDFTVEWFSYQSDLSQFQRIFTVGDFPNISIGASIEGGTFYYWANNTFRFSAAAAATVNTWHHWAIVRISGVTRIYRDGTQLGSQITDTNNITNNTLPLIVGNTNTFATNAALVGDLTNFRFVKGYGVYSAAFTVPTSRLQAVSNGNPYGGSNTRPVPPEATKLLLVP